MLSRIMLSGRMTSRRRMPMASSGKLKTTLRRKKSLGSMPSPAFARAGPPPSRGQALEPVNRLAVALAVGVVHRGEQVGRPRQLELDHDDNFAGALPRRLFPRGGHGRTMPVQP